MQKWHTLGGHVQSLWKILWRYFRKPNIELPYDAAISLLGICPEKTVIQKDACTPMFTAALFTIAKTWKQSKCPLTDEWIRRCGTYTQWKYYSVIKKHKIMPFAATWMELATLILSEVSQKKKSNTIWYHLFVESKYGTDYPIYKTETEIIFCDLTCLVAHLSF